MKRPSSRLLFSFLAALLAFSKAAPAWAQEAGKESAAKESSNEDANNPLAKIQAFNVQDYYVPAGRTVFNVFVEPQFTVLSHGPGQPELQIFVGFNTQFVKK